MIKAVAATSPGNVEIVDVPMPTINEYECLVKVKACGLCNGTDLKIIDGEISDLVVDYPVIIGHEGVGEVVEVGGKVRNIKCGDVFTNPAGRLEPGTPFVAMWAAMKEYAIVQDHQVMDEMGVERGAYTGFAARRIPAEICSEDAGVLLTLKECRSALINFGFRAGMDALVYGDGPTGLAIVNFLRTGGARWVGCVGHWADRLQRALDVGKADLVINSNEEDVADKVGDMRLDMVVDAVGSTAIIKQSSQLLKPGGKVCVFGVLKKKHSELSLIDLRNNTAVHMLNWPYQEHAVHDELVQMVLNGTLNLKDYYSHVMPLKDAAEAVRKVRSREAFKIVIKM